MSRVTSPSTCPSACDLTSVRKSLLKLKELKADYTMEFIWIMAKYGACEKERVRELVSTLTMKRHLAQLWGRLQEILARWP
jgi:hypothetical protein